MKIPDDRFIRAGSDEKEFETLLAELKSFRKGSYLGGAIGLVGFIVLLLSGIFVEEDSPVMTILMPMMFALAAGMSFAIGYAADLVAKVLLLIREKLDS